MSSPERADVLLDARLTRRMSVGMASYARELAARLPVVASDLRFECWRRGGNFGVDEQVRLPAYALHRRPRLVHHLSVYAPIWMPVPVTITIHDLIHLRFPGQFKRSVRPYYETVVRAVCARATRVITDDPRTVGVLERYLGVNPRKIRVVPLGIDEAFLGDGAAEPAERPYFLFAGNHRAHKDLPTLVAAWQALPEDRAVDLVLTGDDNVPALRSAGRRNGALRFTGDVPPEALARLYRGSVAYVHPARREGFGLPMLEAAAAGARVIASRDAIPAVLYRVAEIFPTGDAPALSALLQSALDEPFDAARRERLRATARSYTWDRVAAATAEVYREALGEVHAG